MTKDYNFNFLLKYLYNETSLTKTLEIENSIDTDKNVREQYNLLKKGYNKFPKVQFYPSDKAINNVLSYSMRNAAFDTIC